ncbi:MAG: oligosaccharide flippase family protein [Candidatus Dependentiae bacterium]
MHFTKPIFSGAYHILQEVKKYRPIIMQFFVFSFGTLFTRGISLIFAPITMHMLSPTDYGLLALANSFISILSACLGLGLRQALPLFYFEYNRQQKIDLIHDIISLYTFISVTIVCIILWQLNFVNQLIFANESSHTLLILSLFISFIYFFVELFYQLLQYRQKAWLLTKIQSLIALLIIVCNLFFLCIMQWGLISILLGQAIGMTCVIAIAIRTYYKYHIYMPINAKRTIYTMNSYIWYGLPFIPSMLFGTLLASGDRWVLAHLSSMHNVGIYSLANTLTQLINMILLYAITGSYMPHLLNTFHTQKNRIFAIEQENKKIMWFCMCASFLILSIGFGCTKSILYWLIPLKFHEAINYMGLLLIGSVFYLGTHFLNCLIQYHKKSRFLGFVLILPASLNIVLNILLVPYFSIYGCVIATLISYVMYFLITLLYNKKLCLYSNLTMHK